MIKQLITLCIALIFTTGSWAQESSLLWKISGNGLTEDSYLFGTIHLLCQDDLLVSDELKKAIESSDVLVLELDYDDPSMMIEIQQMMMLPEGERISTLLSEEDYSTLKDFFLDKAGIPITNFDGMKPFLLMSLIYPIAMECNPGSYETVLTQLAAEQEIEVEGLETVKEQMGAIDSWSQKEMAEMLMESIEDFDATKDEYSRLVSVYKENNPEALHELILDASSDMNINDFNEIMLDDRNKKWISRIREKALEQPTVFAVGAGHLGGENGLINLLKKEGYQLTPIKQD